MSGSVSKSKNDPSESLQMMERPLMTADELKAIPKGNFIVMKTGVHPMRTRLRLFLDWGITFEEPYVLPEQAARKVAYADKNAVMRSIDRKYPKPKAKQPPRKSEPVREAQRKEPRIVEEGEGISASRSYVFNTGGRRE
jgi:type IV secretion system protein VirD4